MDVFYANLKNIPTTLIKNPKRKPLIGQGIKQQQQQQQQQQLLPPPPGIPIGKTSIDLTSNKKDKLKEDSNWIHHWKAL